MKAEALSYSDDALEASLCERSFHEFIRYSWPVLHPATPFIDGWVIEAMAEHMQAWIDGEIKKLVINVAIKMTKSILASVDLTPYVWIKRPSASFLYCSYSADLASEHSLLCRRLIESEWYQNKWPHIKLSTDQREKMHYDNTEHGTRAAFGMTSVTGHGSLFSIVDDPHDREDWKHPNEIKRSIDAYDAGIYSAVTDPIEARRLVIGQRVTANDLSAHLKAQGGWEFLVIPTEYDPKRSTVTSLGWKDPRKKEYELACPKRWDREAVDAVKKNLRLYSAYHQQDPTTDEGAIFKRSDWRHYSDQPDAIIGKMDYVVQSWDLTSGGPHPGSSKVAGHVWGKLGSRKFLFDRVLEYMDMPRTLQAIRQMTERWPQARAKIIENKAAGNATIALLEKEISGILPWPPEGQKQDSKETYALLIQPDHQGHNLFLPSPGICPWVPEFIELMAAFPDGDFDDDTDSCSHAILYLDRIPSVNKGPIGVGKTQGWLK